MHRSRFFVVLNLFLCLGTLMVAAQQAEDLSKLDLATLQQHAIAGNAAAQLVLGRDLLGHRYTTNNPIPPDYQQAVMWLRKAGEQGEQDAWAALASLYSHEKDFDVSDRENTLPKDDAEAAYWYKKLAENGDGQAQFTIGKMYQEGDGVSRDDATALSWYLKSANQGKPEAAYSAGMMYEHGWGTPQNNALAQSWFLKSGPLDVARAELIKMGVEPPPVSPGLLDLAALTQRAVAGDIAAETELGRRYVGLGDYSKQTEDYVQAAYWYRKSADAGDPIAQEALGVLYWQGHGVQQDYAQAALWIRKGAESGNTQAEFDLGQVYYKGQGLPEDLHQAQYWLQKAADAHNLDAEIVLKQLNTQLSAASQVATPQTGQTDDAAAKRQDIADKIENLQSDAEMHDNAASGWDDTANNALNNSCTGPGASICAAMGRMGAVKAQSNAEKERAAARNDRSDIARLQGQLDSMSANDSSPTGQNASGKSGGSGSGSSYNPDRHYSGPDSGMVQSLLDSSPGWSCPSSISQSIKWTPPFQQVCMRDYYVTAAVAAAYGAECEARLGRDDEAEKDAESMESSIKSAKSMCSNAPVVANNGPGCSTLAIVPCP